MITGKDIFAAVGLMLAIFLIGAILGTAIEIWDEWRSKK